MKSEKANFGNTLKNYAVTLTTKTLDNGTRLWERNSYRTMKQILNIKRFACQNQQTIVGNGVRIENICSPSTAV